MASEENQPLMRDVNIPDYLESKEMSCLERVEIQFHKVVSLFPVTLSFGMFTYLLVYYIYVSRPATILTSVQFFLYPTIFMDFSRIGFKSQWHDSEEEARSDSQAALIYLILFSYFSLCLLISLIRVIGTSPGNIPEAIEWDMDYVR